MVTEKQFLDVLNTVLSRPNMFRIHRVEDLWIFIWAEVLINGNEAVAQWSGKFSEFVMKEINTALVGFDWSKIIRLVSESDVHSLELFKQMYWKFINQ
jgi:hypothetical protein